MRKRRGKAFQPWGTSLHQLRCKRRASPNALHDAPNSSGFGKPPTGLRLHCSSGFSPQSPFLYHALSAHDLFQPLQHTPDLLLCSPTQRGAWPRNKPRLGVCWGREGENEGESKVCGAQRSGIVPAWLLFLVFQALALQEHLNYYSSAIK